MARGISLHIGVNDVDPAAYGGWSGPLEACEADAEAMQAIARKQGFDTTRLLTPQATRGAVTEAIRDAAARLREGDIFLLSYAGHGGQVADVSGDEDDGIDETWCLYDGQLIDDELGALWPDFAAGTRLLVLSDSCHSGTVTRAIEAVGGMASIVATDTRLGLDANQVRYRMMPASVAVAAYRAGREIYDAAQHDIAAHAELEIAATVRLLSGCQDDQLSRELNGHGLFTRAVMDVWADGAFAGDYAGFHRDILSLMPTVQRPNHRRDGAPNPAYDAEKPFTI